MLSVFILGWAMGVVSALGAVVGVRAWRLAYGKRLENPRTDAQRANARYYEDVVANRAAWRSAPLRRRTARGPQRLRPRKTAE